MLFFFITRMCFKDVFVYIRVIWRTCFPAYTGHVQSYSRSHRLPTDIRKKENYSCIRYVANVPYEDGHLILDAPSLPLHLLHLLRLPLHHLPCTQQPCPDRSQQQWSCNGEKMLFCDDEASTGYFCSSHFTR